MITIICPPRGGKTTELIKIAGDKNYNIACLNGDECEMIFDMAKQMDCPIRYPLTYEEVRTRKYYRPGTTGILIDNIDRFFNYCFGPEIVGFSLDQPITTQIENESSSEQ